MSEHCICDHIEGEHPDCPMHAPVSRPARTEPDGETETLALLWPGKYDNRTRTWEWCGCVATALEHFTAGFCPLLRLLAARDAENRAKALDDAADEFDRHQRARSREDQRIHPAAESCTWLRARAAALRSGDGS